MPTSQVSANAERVASVATRVTGQILQGGISRPILDMVSRPVPRALQTQSQEITLMAAFPELRKWVGARKRQGAFNKKIKMVMERYESTVPVKDKALIFPDDQALADTVSFVSQSLLEGAEHSMVLHACQVMFENQTTYDNASFFDTSHTQIDDKTASNLFTKSRSNNAAMTMDDAKKELQEASRVIARNNIVRSTPYLVNQATQSMVVIAQSDADEAAYSDLLEQDEFDNGRVNGFKGRFNLIRNPTPGAGDDHKPIFVRALPGGPRPVLHLEAGDLLSGITFKDRIFDEQLVDYGIDGHYAFGAGWWQYACKRTS